MSTFIILANYTEQGIANVKQSPKRLDAARELAKSMGATLKDFYLCMGVYDMAVIVEAPNDEAVAKLALALGSAGNVRTTTIRAFAEPEYRKIIGALP